MNCPFCDIEMHSTAREYRCAHCRVRFVLTPVGFLNNTRADHGIVYRYDMRLLYPRLPQATRNHPTTSACTALSAT